jgi:hypothetical protein
MVRVIADVRQQARTVQPVAIELVQIDAFGTLQIYPAIASIENYEYIYRTASAVRWLPKERALTTVGLHGWPQARCFRHILSAVRSEYGHALKLGHDTKWVNVSSTDRSAIEVAANDEAAV